MIKLAKTLGLLKNLPHIIDSMQIRISELTANANNWTTNIIDTVRADFEYETTELERRVDRLEDDFGSLECDMDDYKYDVNTLEHKVDDHEDRIDDLESNWESDIPRLFDRYNELENQLSIVEHKVETQQFEIEALKEQIKTLIELNNLKQKEEE